MEEQVEPKRLKKQKIEIILLSVGFLSIIAILYYVLIIWLPRQGCLTCGG